MKSAPLISVIIPLYNGEAYIQRSVKSVLAQTYINFELIVVNDGSTDAGSEVVRNIFDPRLRLLHQSNMGVSAARNKGIAEAKGIYIAFLDADDEWDILLLESLVNLSYMYPFAGIYGSGYRWISLNGKVHEISISELNDQKKSVLIKDCIYRLSYMYIITSSGVMIPKYIFEELGIFKVGEHYEEDEEMWCRIACYYNVAYDTRILYTYYQTESIGKPRYKKPQQYSPTIRALDEYILRGADGLCSKDEAIFRINKLFHNKICNLIYRNQRASAVSYLKDFNTLNGLSIMMRLIKYKIFWPYIYTIFFGKRVIAFISNRFKRNILRYDIFVKGGTYLRYI